jgi:hypothetical protein
MEAEMSTTLPTLPPRTAYLTWLPVLLRDTTSGWYAMIQAQYRAPNYAITATELAHAARYKNWRGANLQYGKMGAHLRTLMDYNDDAYLNGEAQSSYILSKFYPPGAIGNEHWLFVMHDEVAEALRELGWT